MSVDNLQFFVVGILSGIVGFYLADQILTLYYVLKYKTRVNATFNVPRNSANVHIRGSLEGAINQMETFVRVFGKYIEAEEPPIEYYNEEG